MRLPRCVICRGVIDAEARFKGCKRTCNRTDCKRELHRRSCAAWNRKNRECYQAARIVKKIYPAADAGGAEAGPAAVDWSAVENLHGQQAIIALKEILRRVSQRA